MNTFIEDGLRHHNAGDLEKAEASYLDAVAANSSDAQALKLLALLQAERGQFEDAVSYAEAAVTLRPSDGECSHLLGRIRVELKDFAAAVPALRQATQNPGPNPVAVWTDLGLCLERTGEWVEAKGAFAQLLKLDPAHRTALHGAARVAQALGELNAAEAFFQRAIAVDAKDAEAWTGLAVVEQQRGNLEAALKHAEHACSIAPDVLPCVAARNEIQAGLNKAVKSGAAS